MNWRVTTLILISFITGLGVLVAILARPPAAPHHELYVNGVVITMDASNTVAEAVLVRAGQIEAVGSSEDLVSRIDDDTVVVDLRGRALMPGFIDAHGHFPGSGQTVFSVDLNSPPIGRVTDMEGLLGSLSAFAKQRRDGWVVGHGYDDTLLAEKRHPTRDDLDRISTSRPVAIVHVSGHLAVVNTVGLDILGIDESTPDPLGGVIVRDPLSADGRRPNGVLEETAARAVWEYTLDLGVMDGVRMTTQAAAEYLSVGVTTASAGGMPTSVAKLLGLLSRLNQFPQRVALFPLFEEVGEALLSEELTLDAFAAGKVSVPRVKIIADGSIQGYTGYLSEPYYAPFKGDPLYRGYPSVPREELLRQVSGLYERRIQVAIHCNGDASIDDGLDAIEAAMKAHPWPDARPLIIHAQMTRLDQIERMAALGVTPSFFSAHTYYWGDRHAAIFMGPGRAANMSPARWALEAGVRFSSHLDTPVTPMLPLQAVWSQISRESTAGVVIGPEQRIDRTSALRAVTIDAAWQVFMDDKIGSIEPGKRADLVVLSDNPLTAGDVRSIKVDRTVIDGATVYSRL
ncbi:MAG: amidohydrolase family protein [Luminiphilus sp.]|jgi:predicted amidohydrolase YtcJ|nr:amidohydrolase family protein [Luminiphilus sp.]MBL6898061.1 amidohydrolase family protein [Luminiphilus sp.]MDA8554157.1 amidohydrolase family protein [Luminiphilus sp.]MDB2364708.1 amidohydrolase family protein [Luminiphilus sp.]MDC1161090.1 amidohydrolase family protein [Luminiphilus sp.]